MVWIVYHIIALGAVLQLNVCDGANILCIFPVPSYSHQQPLLAVSRELAARGHNLIVINTNPTKTPLKNHRDIDLGFLYNEFEELRKRGLSLQSRISPYKIVHDYKLFMEFITPKALEAPQVQQLIKEINGTKFDLIFYESIMLSSFLGFSELVGNPPIVGMLTINPFVISDPLVGNPEIPSYIPSVLLPNEHRMTFVERVNNFLINAYYHYVKIRYMDPLQEIYIKRYFGNVKHTAYEMERNISLMLISSDLASSYPKPIHPNTIYVGPTHIEKNFPPLPQDIQKWMDDSEDGVIYFSLGSNMKGTSVPAEKRNAFIRAFSMFPRVRVLWKWESDEKLPGQPDNVLVKKWLPQQAILAHPKTRIFISQVGLQSMQEATHYGVPILGVPLFADQDFNARKLMQAGAGRAVDFHYVAFENIYENLKELLTNSSYAENMRILSRITKDKPMPAVETAVWWIEYVLRHNGAPHLRPACKDLVWYQYYSLDIIAAIGATIMLILTLSYSTVKMIVKKLVNSKLKTQ
nr:UDP-glucuronosyltransferase [Nilaparvata lugens]